VSLEKLVVVVVVLVINDEVLTFDCVMVGAGGVVVGERQMK
jgi:hypothetical protein